MVLLHIAELVCKVFKPASQHAMSSAFLMLAADIMVLPCLRAVRRCTSLPQDFWIWTGRVGQLLELAYRQKMLQKPC